VTNDATVTNDVSRYDKHPIAFVLRFVYRRWAAHAAILATVLAAVGCLVGTQYGIKLLVDTMMHPGTEGGAADVRPAFGLLVALVAADSVLWRLARLIAHSAFVGVTGDLRRDLFRHLTGHAPGYFAQRA
jgi:ATP-binding cassette, subfamily B, bacterial